MDGLTSWQLGYLDGAYDAAHWRGEECSYDYEGPVTLKGEDEDYDDGYWDGWKNTEALAEEYVNNARNWSEWLCDALADGELPSDMHDVMSAFTDFEATIAELRRQLREQETRPPRYTHRNGETTKPEQYGHYWIEDGGETTIDFLGHRYSDNKLEWSDWHTNPTTHARYYGPIPQPITKETNP